MADVTLVSGDAAKGVEELARRHGFDTEAIAMKVPITRKCPSCSSVVI